MSTITRLIYCSENLVGHHHCELQLDQLIRTARSNNNRDQITGCLIYSNLCFAQVLEGPDEHVRTTFAKVRLDPRHRNVFVLQLKSAAKRLFEQWSMMFYRSDEGFEPKSGLAFRTALDREDLDRNGLLDILTLTVVAETRRLEACLSPVSSATHELTETEAAVSHGHWLTAVAPSTKPASRPIGSLSPRGDNFVSLQDHRAARAM